MLFFFLGELRQQIESYKKGLRVQFGDRILVWHVQGLGLQHCQRKKGEERRGEERKL
jgi:hypothetical protein